MNTLVCCPCPSEFGVRKVEDLPGGMPMKPGYLWRHADLAAEEIGRAGESGAADGIASN
jgi:hypothetical protein